MGSWAELDAVYPPGALTPGAALVALVGHVLGMGSVYGAEGPAGWLPRGLAYDRDLLARAERYLAELPLAQLLAEAAALLQPRQKLVAALNLIDAQQLAGDPAAEARAAQILAGLGADAEQLAAHRRTLALKNDLALFPQ